MDISKDKRNIEVCTSLSAMNGQIFRKSGTMVNPVFSGSKMAWLKETQPEIYKKADRIFVVADYLLYHTLRHLHDMCQNKHLSFLLSLPHLL